MGIAIRIGDFDIYRARDASLQTSSQCLFHGITSRRENPFGEEQLFLNNTEVLYASHFNESRPTKFIVHGFSDTGNEGWIRDLIDGGWN